MTAHPCRRPSLRVLAAVLVAGLPACRAADREGVEEVFNFFPLARLERHDTPAGHQLDVLWPLIATHREGDASGSRVLPLYLHEDDGAGERFTNVLLLYWQTLSEERRERWLFPFVRIKRSADEDVTWLWPLFGTRTFDTGSTILRHRYALWPLFAWDGPIDGALRTLSVVALSPLATLFHREVQAEPSAQGDPLHHTSLVSVLDDLVHLLCVERSQTAEFQEAAEEDAEPETIAVVHEKSSAAGALGIAAWRRESEVEGPGFASVLNLNPHVPRASWFVTQHDGEGGEYAHLFPLYFRREAGAAGDFYLLPLFGRSRRDASWERTWIVPPLFAWTRDPARNLKGWDVLWPLIHYHGEGDGAEREAHVRALPLAWFTWRPDSEVQLILPLYYHLRDAEGDYRHLIPFWGRNVEEGGAVRTDYALLPLYLRHQDDRIRERTTHLLWPLSEFGSSINGTWNRVFPLWYFRRSEGRSHLNVLGAFDRVESEVSTSTLLYPLYHSRRDAGEGARASLLPLLDLRFFGESPPQGDEIAVLFPLSSFRRSHDGDTARWIFPTYWWFDDHEGHSTKHLWPLWGVNRDGGRTTWSTLFPLFFHGRDAHDPAWWKWGVLFPFGFFSRNGDTRTDWLFPLWYHSHDEDDALSWVLWPLFLHEREDGRTLWHSLFHLLRYEQEDDVEQFSVLYALYRGRTEGARTTRSVPFLFHYENDGGERILRLFHLVPIRW